MIVAGFILFGLAVLLYLLAAKNGAPEPAPARDADIATLVAEHDAQTFASDAERAESEYRLYHAIRHIENRRGKAQRLPVALLALAPLLLLGASWLWYGHLGGNFALHWQELTGKLAPALTRSQHLGELPQSLDEQAQHTYCQALQSRIDRQDRDQLDTLGRCYAQYGNHPAAADVYRHLMRLDPQNDHTALQYAQSSLFAHPDQAMSADVEAILTRLYRQNRKDTLTGILLATAYTRAGEREKALPLWQQLKADTDPGHPLYSLIDSTAAQMASNTDANPPAPAATNGIGERPVTIRIPQTLLGRLPSGSQLFVMISGKDSPMPLAVEKLDPRDTQTIRFTREHSMSGATFLERDDLVIRAFISADGSVSGERFGDIRQELHIDTHPTLEFPAHE